MRAPRPSVVLLSLVLAASATFAQDPPPGEPGDEAPAPSRETSVDEELAAAGRTLVELRDVQAEAFARMEAQDWEACVAAFREVAEAAEPHPLLAGVRDQSLYNVACALAHLDREDEAAAALAEALGHGLRPIASVAGGARIVLQPGLTFAHVLADPDLDPLRDRDDVVALLATLLQAGEPVVEPTSAVTGGAAVPGVVVLVPAGAHLDDVAPPWREALAEIPAVLAFVEGPVRPSPRIPRWLLEDGDERFGVEKAAAALAALRADPRVDAARVFVAATGPTAGEVALATALAHPADVAGLALGPLRFHRAWHADALARVADVRGASPWRVTTIAADALLPDALRAAGCRVTILDPPPPVVAPDQRSDAARRALADGLAALLR